MIEHLGNFLIFFGGFMSLTIALGLLLENEKGLYHLFFSGYMLCLGGLQLLDGLFVMDMLNEYPGLLLWRLPLLAWIGPFFFCAFKSSSNESFSFRPAMTLHFMPGMLVLLLMIPFFAMEQDAKLSLNMRPPRLDVSDSHMFFYSLLFAAVIFTLIAYLAYFIWKTLFMYNIRLIRKKKVSPYLAIIMTLTFPLFVVFFAGMVTIGLLGRGSSLYVRLIQVLTTLSFIPTLVIFVMEKKKINFFMQLKSHILQRQYEVSTLKNLDVSPVVQRIKSLMEEEKIFHDEALSVNGVAEMLSVKPYQLSRIINEHFNKNFNYFVNEYRIEEAKRLFREDQDRTIISVAYAVGFNSTTVFNDWFKRITGDPPKKFRGDVRLQQLVAAGD